MASKSLTWQAAARLFDHTLLKPEATVAQVRKLCREAIDCNFFSVMVNPTHVSTAVGMLRGTPVVVGTVIGFPLGANTTATKVIETQDALRAGAKEIDMVINVGLLKSGETEDVQREIQRIADTTHSQNALLKVIIETALLTDEEKVQACRLAVAAGADFVKTSTGFAATGATVKDVRLMRETVGDSVGVKAAGGIRTAEDLLAMVEAGANRIGASACVSIVRELGFPA